MKLKFSWKDYPLEKRLHLMPLPENRGKLHDGNFAFYCAYTEGEKGLDIDAARKTLEYLVETKYPEVEIVEDGTSDESHFLGDVEGV